MIRPALLDWSARTTTWATLPSRKVCRRPTAGTGIRGASLLRDGGGQHGLVKDVVSPRLSCHWSMAFWRLPARSSRASRRTYAHGLPRGDLERGVTDSSATAAAMDHSRQCVNRPSRRPIRAGSALTRSFESDSRRRRRGWSHLWSHSGRFSRVRVGLKGLPLRGAGRHRTRPIRRPQNSKACEVKASEGSNPSATAN